MLKNREDWKSWPRNWVNITFFTFTHLVSLFTVFYIVQNFWQIPLQTWILFGFMYLATGLSITAGYHRLYAHRAYRAAKPVQLFFLLFGAAAFQDSVLKWVSDHRLHHGNTDEEHDPYAFPRGFYFAHIGWIFRHRPKDWAEKNLTSDLKRDPFVVWQNRHYLSIAILTSFALPAFLGGIWGDVWGAFLIAGVLRLTLTHHATFCINSVAHWIGNQPFPTNISPRNCWWIAIVTFGEGYHAYHHRFARDYRNGVRWWQWDPTKWLIRTLTWLDLAWNLHKVPEADIEAAMKGGHSH